MAGGSVIAASVARGPCRPPYGDARGGAAAPACSPDDLRDLPRGARRVGEGGGPPAPRPVDRAVEQGHAVSPQLGDRAVHVLDPDGEERAGAGARRADRGRLDQGRRVPHREQIDHQIAELDDGGIGVLVDHLEPEDVRVERPAGPDVLDEQGDDLELVQSLDHGGTPPDSAAGVTVSTDLFAGTARRFYRVPTGAAATSG